MTGVTQPVYPVPRAHRRTRTRRWHPITRIRRIVWACVPKLKTVLVVLILTAAGAGVGASHAYAFVAGQESVANPIGIESINGGQGEGYWIQFEKGPVVHTLSYREAIGQCFAYQKLKAQASCKGTTRSTFWWVHMFKRTLRQGP